MSWIPDRYRELRSLLRPDRVEDDVDEELLFHLTQRERDLVAAGLPPQQAREEALRRFGDIARFRAETCSIDESVIKERRRMELFDAVRRETRHALRSLGRAPMFTAVAILTLALGIGATTAIFSLLDSIVLRPLPYPAQDRVVQMVHYLPGVGPDARWGNSVASYFFYLDNNRSFEEMGGGSGGTAALSGDGEAERVPAATVTASMLRILGARAVLGRLLTDDDDQPGAPAAVMIGEDLWRSRYNSDPSIIGRTITVNSEPVPVVGVMASGVSLPSSLSWPSSGGAPAQVWSAFQLDRAQEAVNSHWVSTYARLRPGVTPEAAERDLAQLTARMPEEFPNAYSESWYESTGFRPEVATIRAVLLGSIEKSLWLLLGAVALVLLIAAANVGNLLLVRHEARRREQTVRAALGAGRAHFAVQYLTESLLLGTAAGLAGLLLAYLGVRSLLALSPPGLPRLGEVGVSGTAVTFAIGISLLTALLFGLIPVLRGRINYSELRGSGRGMTSGRERQLVRSGLVVGQVGLALVLLAAGALMLRSFMNLRSVDAGIDPDNVLTFQLFAPGARYPTRDAQLDFRRQLSERVLALPGVTAFGATSVLPLSGTSGCSYTTVEGAVYYRFPGDDPPCMPNSHVLPGFFEALGIRVTGETITWSDVDRAAGVAVVSRAFADRIWPGEDPIGKGVITYRNGPPWYRVVGVAENVRGAGLDMPAVEDIYYPPRAMEGTTSHGPSPTSFVVRASTGDPLSLAPAIRRIVTELDPEVPVANFRTMHDVINTSPTVARTSFTMLLLAVAAFMALFLSAVGLYGVIAYLVGRRRAEIGVRMALGARVGQVARLVVLQSMQLTTLGIVVGIIVALLTTRVLASLLFEVRPADPLTLAGVSALLLLVAMLASAIPARRAARTDPSEALRAD